MRTTGTQTHRPGHARKLRAITYQASTGPEALRATVKLIGQGIKNGAAYVPLIQYARRLASQAAPKDYLNQFKHIFSDVVKRWRYVHDPLRTEMVTISGPEIYGQILGFDFSPPFHGYGDCDDATVLTGALAESLSFRTRIVTLSPPTTTGAKALFTHVYPEILIPRLGWIAADAVGFPAHGLGWQPPALRRAVWDLDGNLLAIQGHYPARIKQQLKTMLRANVRGLTGYEPERFKDMGSLYGIETTDFPDRGLHNFGFAGVDEKEPLDWSTHGLLSFGAYTDGPLGIIGSDRIGLFAEYDESDQIGTLSGVPVVRTKMMEMSPKDLAYIYRMGRPKLGMLALSDDGDVYQWQEEPGLGGFFKKLFRKIGRGVKKIAHGISKGARKLIKKLPGGKYIVKIAGKVKHLALKAVTPILKAGKWLSPIAALVPGYGPALAAVLSQGPRIAAIAKKLGIATDEQGKPKLKTKHEHDRFAHELHRHVEHLRRKQRRMPSRMVLPGTPKHAAIVRGLGAYYA